MSINLTEAINKIFNEEFDFDSTVFFDSTTDQFIESLKKELIEKQEIKFQNITQENKTLLAFLEKFYQSVSVLPEYEKDYLLNQVNINYDIMVISGDTFVPKILINGGVLFRNNHRVIGLSESPVLFKSFDNDFTYDNFIELLESEFSQLDLDDKELNLSYVNRTDTGIEWTTEPPSVFAKHGQSLIIVSGDVLESDNDICVELKEYADQSRTGQLIARVFEHGIYFFTTRRLSDEYDLLCEYYSSYLELDDNQVTIKQNYEDMCKQIQEYSLDIANEVDDLGIDECYVSIVENLKQHLVKNLKDRVSMETYSFNSIFSESIHYPAGHEQKDVPYFQYVKEGSYLTVFQNGLNEIDVEDYVESIKDRVNVLLNHFNPESVYLYFPSLDDQYNHTIKLDIYDFNSDEWIDKINDLMDFLINEFENDGDYEEFQDYMNDSEYLFSALMYTSEIILPEEIHDFTSEFGEDFNQNYCFSIPQIGFIQHYFGTDFDEGNANLFFDPES